MPEELNPPITLVAIFCTILGIIIVAFMMWALIPQISFYSIPLIIALLIIVGCWIGKVTGS
jgi:hypothetical protein